MGLATVAAYVVVWDVLAKTILKGRICTVSSDCWSLQERPLRRAAFWVGVAVGCIHLARRPLENMR